MTQHILVADDEKHTLLALSLILKKEGFEVTTFSDGKETLDRILELSATADPADLLIIDIEMPGMTGLEVVESIENLRLRLPVIVISGYEARELLAKRLRLGGVWFLDKPFEAEEFICRVNEVLKNASEFRRVREFDEGSHEKMEFTLNEDDEGSSP